MLHLLLHLLTYYPPLTFQASAAFFREPSLSHPMEKPYLHSETAGLFFKGSYQIDEDDDDNNDDDIDG